MGGPLGPKRLDSKQSLCMRSFTAHGATWKTASRNSKMDLFADRTSTHWLASNQLRLWFSAFAHLIMSTPSTRARAESLQAGVLKGTELEAASIGQIRLRLFKIAARLKTSARRIHIELCSAYPLKALFSLVHQRLSALGSPA